MADRTGQELGNYRLIRLLGRGGFAEVYLGEHMRLKTQAAIKVLYAQLDHDNSEEFLQEAQTVAHLIHPNIVRIFDFDVKEGVPFLVMDYAQGGTLRQRHPKNSRLPLETIIPYIQQVADALQYAHDEKFIHRDIKPENMLIGRRGEILLSDFGIALIAQSTRMQSTQEVMGTAYYMAPEQLQGKPRLASDQYALGVVVYEWLTGTRPFHGSFSEIASQHMFVPPAPLHEKLPTISPAVEEVVMTALAKDPHQRFGSVRAFANALEQASQPSDARTFIRPSAHLSAPMSPEQLPVMPTQPSQQVQPVQLSTNLSTSQSGPITALSVNQTPTPTVTPPQVLMPSQSRQLSTHSGMQSKPQNKLTKKGTTRRNLLIGIAALTGLIGIGEGVAWYEFFRMGALLYTYRGHSSSVNSVVWSPGGQRIASASFDNTVQVWDAIDGGKAYVYRGHSSAVYAVAWSPNGQRIASASYDDTVQVWDASNGGKVYTYKGHSKPVSSVKWSPNGQRIASASDDGTVQVWDASNGGKVYTYQGQFGPIYALAWSPDGQLIASASSNNTVEVWDASNGGNIKIYTGHTGTVDSVAWSPSGQLIASASVDDTVQVWDASYEINDYTYQGHSKSVYSVAWSPDGKRIASASADRTVQIWDATNGGNAYIYSGHSGSVNSVAWSPNGQLIASGSDDKTVQVWQAS